jgi:hypothetical protein
MALEPDTDAPHDETKRIVIRVFGNHEAAQVAATNLEAHDLECWITSDDAGGMLPNLSAPRGVRLLVLASDAEAAAALLDSQAPIEPGVEPTSPQ